MDGLVELFSPWGRTTQSRYWFLLLCLAVGAFGIAEAKDYIGSMAVFILLGAIQIIIFVTTIRRLGDANWSRWWVLLCLFPASITFDLFHLQVGSSTWQFVDVSAVVRLIPLFIGLFAVSRRVGDDARLGAVFV